MKVLGKSIVVWKAEGGAWKAGMSLLATSHALSVYGYTGTRVHGYTGTLVHCCEDMDATKILSSYLGDDSHVLSRRPAASIAAARCSWSE
jgi:hypothetical protein